MKTGYTIEPAIKHDYPELIAIWEASVRSTHHFLKEDDLQLFKQLIFDQYFDAVDLYVARDIEGRPLGLMGVVAHHLEMLFVHPDVHGKGLGKFLLSYALNSLGVTHVDVNEANEKALQFYRHFGFEVVKRSETDGLGKPYPILHLALKTTV
ncbi:GNAT family N-acetyltransferase [Pedobacter sp. KR3-3]|uniref:GNAT family N-acetyltransferase n=1 Tax=Pedobacter albus TaxID=3113905 RepID=A0ABU7IBS1_9SPHI|nr:GNAT family N-acetyltransferase [Pedobacter sp. KR3-3]MEE1946940.1 GNAT family N-acetyltransferase [Pedobacter sp. KR3-3]